MPYLIDKTNIRDRIREKGFRSVSDFCEAAGIHRNTLNYYFRGEPVISEKLETVLAMLNMTLDDAVTHVGPRGDTSLKPVAALLDELCAADPSACFVLFGSRASGQNKKYSDFDIGAFSHNALSRQKYSQLLNIKEAFEERSPFFVDVVNFNNASDTFLHNVAKDWKFIGGNVQSWVALNERVDATDG